jgi:hypothetical protein
VDVLFFSAKKKVPKKKLPAAPGSVKGSASAKPVLPEPANADFFGY